LIAFNDCASGCRAIFARRIPRRAIAVGFNAQPFSAGWNDIYVWICATTATTAAFADFDCAASGTAGSDVYRTAFKLWLARNIDTELGGDFIFFA